MRQTVDGQTIDYVLDLNSDLTQVLEDGTNRYLYGVDRFAQVHGGQSDYFLGDALGSVRQLADDSAAITLAQSYEPYGVVNGSTGVGATIYGYTGEIGDQTGLTYLRARYYAPAFGRFITRDTWSGINQMPLTLNRWIYALGGPVSRTDPSGHIPLICQYAPSPALYERCVLFYYRLEPIDPRSIGSHITGQMGCYQGKIDYRALGYIEGIGGFLPPAVGEYVTQTWGGEEIVYDFAAMQSHRFTYTGPGVANSILGAGVSLYMGLAMGFRSDRNVVRDYGGPFVVFQGGPALSVGIGASAGMGYFVSTTDAMVRGWTAFIGGSAAMSDWLKGITVGGAYLLYEPEAYTLTPYGNAGVVDKGRLFSDIMTGLNSPWGRTLDTGMAIVPAAMNRAAGAGLAMFYSRAYEDLQHDQ